MHARPETAHECEESLACIIRKYTCSIESLHFTTAAFAADRTPVRPLKCRETAV